MISMLRFLRRACLVISTALCLQPKWHRCPKCGIYQRDGVATSAQPPEGAWVEDEPRICLPCRHHNEVRIQSWL